jgi:hypothetical protein
MFAKNWKNRSHLAQSGATYVNLPHAKVFEQVKIPLTLRVLANFLQFFLAKLDCSIDFRLGHDKRIKKIDTIEKSSGSNGRR